MILSVIAAAAPPLVINVLSSCGEDLCGASFCPAVSDCAGASGWTFEEDGAVLA
jgi:hypothetical protein